MVPYYLKGFPIVAVRVLDLDSVSYCYCLLVSVNQLVEVGELALALGSFYFAIRSHLL